MKLLLLVGIGALLAVQAQAATVKQWSVLNNDGTQSCPPGTKPCNPGVRKCDCPDDSSIKGRELDDMESATREEALIQKILDLTDSLKREGGSRYGCSINDDPAWCQTADLWRCGTMHPVDAECGCHCHLVQEHQNKAQRTALESSKRQEALVQKIEDLTASLEDRKGYHECSIEDEVQQFPDICTDPDLNECWNNCWDVGCVLPDVYVYCGCTCKAHRTEVLGY